MFTRRTGMKATVASLIGGGSEQWLHAAHQANTTPASTTSTTPVAALETDNAGPSLDRPIYLMWTHEGLGPMYTAPTYADGRLYLPKATDVVAVEAATGTELWSVGIPAYTIGSPLVSDGVVYVVTFNRGGGDSPIYMLDAMTGDEIGLLQPNTIDFQVPVIANGIMYVGDGDGSCRAIDLSTQQTLWAIAGAAGSTAVDTDTVYVAISQSEIRALSRADGQERWRVPLSGMISPPVLTDGMLYVRVDDPAVQGLDATTGERVFTVPLTEGGSSQPVVIDGVLVIDELELVHGIDARTGEERWRFADGSFRVVSSLVGSNGVVYVGTTSLISLDAQTGNEFFRYGLEDGIMMTRVIEGGGRVYVSSGDRKFQALGNLPTTHLLTDVTLRGAPTLTGVERGTYPAGTEITRVGEQDSSAGTTWVEVTIGDSTGWVPASAVDTTALPAAGELETVYEP